MSEAELLSLSDTELHAAYTRARATTAATRAAMDAKMLDILLTTKPNTPERTMAAIGLIILLPPAEIASKEANRLGRELIDRITTGMGSSRPKEA